MGGLCNIFVKLHIILLSKLSKAEQFQGVTFAQGSPNFGEVIKISFILKIDRQVVYDDFNIFEAQLFE